MDNISQTTFSNVFASIKMFEFRLNSHWKLVHSGLINMIDLDNGLAPTRRQAIIWTNDDYFADVYMRHSASMS